MLRNRERSGHVVVTRNRTILFPVGLGPLARGVESRAGLIARVEVPADSDGSGGGDEAGGDTRAEREDRERRRGCHSQAARDRVGVGAEAVRHACAVQTESLRLASARGAGGVASVWPDFPEQPGPRSRVGRGAPDPQRRARARTGGREGCCGHGGQAPCRAGGRAEDRHREVCSRDRDDDDPGRGGTEATERRERAWLGLGFGLELGFGLGLRSGLRLSRPSGASVPGSGSGSGSGSG